MTNIIDALTWRYATKKFDIDKKLTDVQLETIIEAVRLAPSSYGLYPYKVIVVTSGEVRARLREAAWGQPQITDASHLIVFAVKKNINTETVAEYMRLVSSVRSTPVESLQGFSDMINSALGTVGTPENIENWAIRQAYLGLGIGLTTAAIEGIDACPMEGFNSAEFDEILGLGALGLTSKVLMAVGFRSSGDGTMEYPKVRFPKEEMRIEVK